MNKIQQYLHIHKYCIHCKSVRQPFNTEIYICWYATNSAPPKQLVYADEYLLTLKNRCRQYRKIT